MINLSRTMVAPVFWLLDKVAMSCDVHTQIVSASFDRRLTLFEKIKYHIHGIACHFCRRYERQLNGMRKAARINALEFGQRTHRTMSPESKARIKELLKGG